MKIDRRLDRIEREYGRSDGITVAIAADFMTGGSPIAAEVYDRKGESIAAFARQAEETFAAFRERVIVAARPLPGAARVKIGGLARAPSVSFLGPREGVPRGAVTLPEVPLHDSQLRALELIVTNRKVAIAAGRRWGKTVLLAMLAIDAALSNQYVGLFTPTYKLLGPLVESIVLALKVLPGISTNRALGEIRLEGGGAIDMWSLDYTSRGGRGRKYHWALIDESAHDEGRLADSFPTSIAPTLIDFFGSVVTTSTPNGLEGWFYDIAHDPRHGFATFHAPTSSNPHLSAAAIAEARASSPRSEWAAQELDAEFIDTYGATIFPLSALLIDGKPHPDDFPCQTVGLAIDSNSGKGGPDRDGCAAVIFALTMPNAVRGSFEGTRIVLLDWDIQSLAQGGIPAWLQHVRGLALSWFRRLKPLGGPPVAHIEPAGNGYAIIEAARVQGLNPREINTKYVSAGKDARALMVEPHVGAGRLKIGRTAFDKRSNYRGILANHLTKQVTGFRAFDKDAYRREDDLYDAAIYAALISLGDGNERRWSRLSWAAP